MRAPVAPLPPASDSGQGTRPALVNQLCPRCHRPTLELHHSLQLHGTCCQDCYERGAPPSDQARHYKPRRERPVPRPRPTEYEQLVTDVHAALDAANVAVHGRTGSVFGLGDPRLPLMGYCPACRTGTVAIRLIRGARASHARTEGCSDGCPGERVLEVIWPR